MKNEETKREKFVRIAEARTNKIINMIQLLGNCSNQSLYEYGGVQYVSVEGKFSMDFF